MLLAALHSPQLRFVTRRACLMSAALPAAALHVFCKDRQTYDEVYQCHQSLQAPDTKDLPLVWHAPGSQQPGTSCQIPTTDGQLPIPALHPQCTFDGHAFMSALPPSAIKPLGRVLLCTHEIGSTQDVLRGGCQGVLQPGCVLLADKQTGGKGRGGNQWVSPDGCLMFSASRQVAILGEQAPFINYLVCLAVLRGIKATLQQLYPARTPPDLGIRIKWPNDIYHMPPASPAAALKIGGALIHTSWSGSGFKVVVGIGLNLTNNQPTTCLQQLLEQAHSSQEPGVSGREPNTCPVISRELLLANVVSHLDECFSVFEQHGFAPLEPDYLSSWMHSGQLVTTQGRVQTGAGTVPTAGGSGRPGEDADGGDSVTLRLRGLSSSGFLLAEEVEAGQHGTRLWELTPDGNSLDMMAGLLRRKV